MISWLPFLPIYVISRICQEIDGRRERAARALIAEQAAKTACARRAG